MNKNDLPKAKNGSLNKLELRNGFYCQSTKQNCRSIAKKESKINCTMKDSALQKHVKRRKTIVLEFFTGFHMGGLDRYTFSQPVKKKVTEK